LFSLASIGSHREARRAMGNCGGREKAEEGPGEPVLVRETTGAAAGDGAAAQAGETAAATPPLEDAKAERVTKLFGKWDFLANGMLPLDMLDQATVDVGPRKSHVMSELRKMDINGDGYVEQKEWVSYFTEIAANLSDPEFELVISDLEDQGEELVTIARCTAIAKEGDADEDLPDGMAEGLGELPAERQAQVQALWDAFDFEGSGRIDREKLETATVSVGSREAKVFANLKDMDLDGDRVVTQDEMFTYFKFVSGGLSDSEFTLIVEEMTEFAIVAAAVAANLKIAMALTGADFGSGGGGEDGDDATVEQPLQISKARYALCSSLFDVFDPTHAPIELSKLTADCTVDVGAYKANVMSAMKDMDINGDGKVEFQELIDYFTVVGEKMSDDEFEGLVSNLIDNAHTAKFIHAAQGS